ncbi:MAG TPA: response regulator [Micrococcaceae bacterium]|jgi:two-component system CitB family response regulator|nr:response regulator [Micrococcaceae bacterium]
MIRTLVVDDDFRVAHIHASRVNRVEGFECVGEVHSAAAARTAIAELKPDLLLLDVYLPDEDGISLMRSLQAAGEPVDIMMITAARDLQTVRSAKRGGAVYYLVKPFGFEALKSQLESYRKWRAETEAKSVVDQAAIDSVFHRRPDAPRPAPSRRLPPTMQKVFDAVAASAAALGAADIADAIGISRPTAQRYLSELERKGLLELKLTYGTTGRPVNTYVPLPR